uniref:Proline/arginine-rich end leucine-rich repeat protein n=1 Tax=Eptatretus burgeri TaxID=7764 RepID=A0A8C4WYA6_EPTBU
MPAHFFFIIVLSMATTQCLTGLQAGDRRELPLTCPESCYCPPDHPVVLHCDARSLNLLPTIPTRIWYAYLQSNKMTTMPASHLANASRIILLQLDSNRIKRIPRSTLSKQTNLITLSLRNNLLNEVPIGLPSSLQELHLSGNLISRVRRTSFQRLSNLRTLDLSHNRMEGHGGHAKAYEALSSLSSLDLSHNILSETPRKIPPGLKKLSLAGNNLTTLPVELLPSLPSLRYLSVAQNSLHEDTCTPWKLDGESLLHVDLSENDLTRVPKFRSTLIRLLLQKNHVKEVNTTVVCQMLDGQPARLSFLRLDGNPVLDARFEPGRGIMARSLALCFPYLRPII